MILIAVPSNQNEFFTLPAQVMYLVQKNLSQINSILIFSFFHLVFYTPYIFYLEEKQE